MKKHKFNIFPEMQSDDYNRLKNDLLINGYDNKQPIYLYENDILDGWNRQKVCNELKIQPIFKDFIGTDSEAIDFVMRSNKRRNLTSSQWATIAIEADEIINTIKQQVENDRLRKQKANASNQFSEPCVEQIPHKAIQRTTEILAQTFNTNSKYVSEAQRLKRDKPEIFEQLKSGEKTITEVQKDEKIEQRKEKIESIKQKIETENLIIKDLYDVIVIDPPWNYGREYNPETSRVANPYPEMTIDEILKIELPLKENAIVFLWTTHAFIREAFNILNKWGLDYKAIITWNKEQMGMGSIIRMQCEFCLLAIKGKPLIEGSSERDIITEKRTFHSCKPDIFYEQVKRMTTGRRLDYFARNKKEGFDYYGTLENEL
jgi:N6-adenosine-specific RNA methylase IME4